MSEWVTLMFSVVLLWSSRPQRCRGRLLQADGWGKTFLFLCTVLPAQTAAGSWHSLLAQREADPAPQQPTGLCVCLCVLVCVCGHWQDRGHQGSAHDDSTKQSTHTYCVHREAPAHSGTVVVCTSVHCGTALSSVMMTGCSGSLRHQWVYSLI